MRELLYTYPIKISCFERCTEVMLVSSRTCTGSCVWDFTRTDDLDNNDKGKQITP